MVLRTIRAGGVPLCIVLGGGYAPTTLRTAQLHCIVFEEAMAQWQRERGHSGGG
jgi:hypothetical protein